MRRWLGEDAIRPWQYQSWIFAIDPYFAVEATRVPDLYARIWDGKPLTVNDYVISADEKTSIRRGAVATHVAGRHVPDEPGQPPL